MISIFCSFFPSNGTFGKFSLFRVSGVGNNKNWAKVGKRGHFSPYSFSFDPAEWGKRDKIYPFAKPV